jgi:hypothetical protein
MKIGHKIWETRRANEKAEAARKTAIANKAWVTRLANAETRGFKYKNVDGENKKKLPSDQGKGLQAVWSYLWEIASDAKPDLP